MFPTECLSIVEISCCRQGEGHPHGRMVIVKNASSPCAGKVGNANDTNIMTVTGMPISHYLIQKRHANKLINNKKENNPTGVQNC